MSNLTKLDKAIRDALQACDSDLMPNVCAMRSTPEGLERVVASCLEKIKFQGGTIANALLDIERSFNENQ
jgi:hypothetical protein